MFVIQPDRATARRENPRGSFRGSENAVRWDATSRLRLLRIAEEICVARRRCQNSPFLQLSRPLCSSVPSSILLPLSAPALSVLSLLFISRCPLSSIYFYVSSSAPLNLLFLSLSCPFLVFWSSYLFPLLPPFFPIPPSPCHFPSLLFSFSVTRTCSRTHVVLFRCSAGTKTDWTVSIVPVSIRFGRVRSNKRQRRIRSTVRPRKDASLESESQVHRQTEALKGFKSVREKERGLLRFPDFAIFWRVE